MTTGTRQTDNAIARGFTLVELMVSMAVLVIAMVAVGYIFSAVSKTSGLTTADIELTDAADVLRRTMQADLNAMAPGFLMVLAYPPVADRRDLPDEPPIPQRRDSLLTFLAVGAPGQFQSFWNPTVTSSEALVTYGPGLTEDPASGDLALPSYLFDSVLSRRAILLVEETLTGTPELDKQWGHGQGATDPDYLPPDRLGAEPWDDKNTFNKLHYSLRSSLVDVIQQRSYQSVILRLRRLLTEGGSSVAFWHTSYAPPALPADAPLDDRGRCCFTLVPHAADFIVEWTDGSVADPRPGTYDSRLQWFGLGRDIDGDGLIRSAVVLPGSSDVISRQQWSMDLMNPPRNIELISNESDPPEPGWSSPAEIMGYWAMWTEQTWQYRPKALRVTVRLYDANKRIRDGAQRLGQVRSFVLEVR